MVKISKSGRCRQVFIHFGPDLGGRWLSLTGGRCSEVALVLKLGFKYMYTFSANCRVGALS